MGKKVLINGFGRMGRLGFRAGYGQPSFQVVHVNDVAGNAETAAHLLAFDSIHGRWDPEVTATAGGFEVGGRSVGFGQVEDIAGLPLEALGIEMVIECTGRRRTAESLAPYFDRGVKKVLVSAPVKEAPAFNVVMGVNDHLYDPTQHNLVTAASCTTNALAPVVKVMLDGPGICRGVVTTIHNVTNTQSLVDKLQGDARRARSSALSMFPTSTNSAYAIAQIFPELAGKLSSVAVRVPIQNSSLIDCVFETKHKTTVEQVNRLFQQASMGPLKRCLGFERRPLVSVDYVNEARSSVVDGLSTQVVDGHLVKVLAWYDSEWGYVNRMMELCGTLARSLSTSAEPC